MSTTVAAALDAAGAALNALTRLALAQPLSAAARANVNVSHNRVREELAAIAGYALPPVAPAAPATSGAVHMPAFTEAL